MWGSCLLWWLNKDFSHQMQMLGIRAQFCKVKQTRLNIGLFAWTKENVNMVNRRFELFYILLQQAPGLQEWNNISVLLGKFCQRKRIFLYPLKRRPRFKSPRLPLSLVTTVIAPWKRVFSHRPSCGTAKRLSKLRKSPSGTIGVHGYGSKVPHNNCPRETETLWENPTCILVGWMWSISNKGNNLLIKNNAGSAARQALIEYYE